MANDECRQRVIRGGTSQVGKNRQPKATYGGRTLIILGDADGEWLPPLHECWHNTESAWCVDTELATDAHEGHRFAARPHRMHGELV
jgi:hypothetical protein